MTNAQLLAAYDRYQTSWVRQDWETFESVLHPAYNFAIGGVPVGDVNDTIEWSRRLLDAFPDYTQVVNARYPSESVLVVEAVASGTSNGQAPGPHVPSPVAGRRFQLPYVKVLRFAQGLIRDDRQYHDAASLTAQLYPTGTHPGFR